MCVLLCNILCVLRRPKNNNNNNQNRKKNLKPARKYTRQRYNSVCSILLGNTNEYEPHQIIFKCCVKRNKQKKTLNYAKNTHTQRG